MKKIAINKCIYSSNFNMKGCKKGVIFGKGEMYKYG